MFMTNDIETKIEIAATKNWIKEIHQARLTLQDAKMKLRMSIDDFSKAYELTGTDAYMNDCDEILNFLKVQLAELIISEDEKSLK